jgi:hypothetical protein
MSKRTDYMHGRQGGRFMPDDWRSIDIERAPRCDVCGNSMILGQTRRHYVCDDKTTVGKSRAWCMSANTSG